MERKRKIPKEVKRLREYKSLQIDRKQVKTISYSQLTQYSKCPHRWSLSYVKKLQTYTPTIHTIFGTAMHNTLQNWLEVVYNVSAKEASEIDLNKYLLEEMKRIYVKERERHGMEISSPAELQEFWLQGCAILKFVKSKRSLYFTTKQMFIVGCEIPLIQELKPGVLFEGYVDVVLYDAKLDEYIIIDIKTSTKGWSKYDKADEDKTAQLILYKQYFSKQFNISVDKIKVKYFIVKRQVPAEVEYASMARRVQEFVPTAGKVKTNRVTKKVDEFLADAFDEKGERIDKVYRTNPSKSNCMFCDYNNDKSLCADAILG